MTSTRDDWIDPKYISLLWAEADAAAEIAGLHADLFDPRWDEPAIEGLLAQPGSHALLAKVRLRLEGPPVTAGFIIGRVAADEAEIISIGVMKPFQRRGIGAKLVEGLMRAVTAAGSGRLILEVATDNAAALTLYRGLGFVEVGRRVAYYKRPNGEFADALVLARPLTPA
ncbi:MAG: GNAT family N-acetyltransferase [Hyphomicrobiaceae bacterium]|nr:GNAT family N-acetyltransferase [Hyphomicrobiaceae bacterium]